LARCEWSHDDYSLNVANLPMAEPSPLVGDEPRSKSSKKTSVGQSGLFDQKDEETDL
jgi:adenine-specific DNA-methyltransferase